MKTILTALAVVTAAVSGLAVVPFVAVAESSGQAMASGIPYKHDDRGLVIADIRRGEQLFQKNCAECHRAQAAGDPQWRVKGPDGKYPPPPLNGTAHAWHHDRMALTRTIKHGTKKIGGSMPGFGDRLSDNEVDQLITYLSSLWPDKVYKVWSKGRGHH